MKEVGIPKVHLLESSLDPIKRIVSEILSEKNGTIKNGNCHIRGLRFTGLSGIRKALELAGHLEIPTLIPLQKGHTIDWCSDFGPKSHR